MASLPIPAPLKPWGGPQDTPKHPWDYMENWKNNNTAIQYYKTIEFIPWQNCNDERKAQDIFSH